GVSLSRARANYFIMSGRKDAFKDYSGRGTSPPSRSFVGQTVPGVHEGKAEPVAERRFLVRLVENEPPGVGCLRERLERKAGPLPARGTRRAVSRRPGERGRGEPGHFSPVRPAAVRRLGKWGRAAPE